MGPLLVIIIRGRRYIREAVFIVSKPPRYAKPYQTVLSRCNMLRQQCRYVSNSFLGDRHEICLSAALLFAVPHVPPARTATAHAKLEKPGEDRKRRCDPHASKHCMANRSFNVEPGVLFKNVSHDGEHDGGDDSSGGDDESIQECKAGEGEGYPTAVHCTREEEHEHKREAGSGEEETKHPL